MYSLTHWLETVSTYIVFILVACQRYLCPYVIPMTMNAFIFKNLSLKTVLLNHMSK